MKTRRCRPTSKSDSPRRQDPPRLVAALWILVGVILFTGVVGGINRGLHERPDWRSLKSESTYVWEHHHSAPGTKMFGYLPTAVFALWPFMVWPPQPLGLFCYVGANLLAGILSLWILRRCWLEPYGPVPLFVMPVLLVSANFQHVVQANQLTLWTLLLCVIGLALVGRGRPFGGGAVLGLAGLIKVLPFLLAGFLVLRRKWTALLGMAAAVILCDIVPSVAFFGSQGALDEHKAWLRRAGWYSSIRQIRQPLLIGVYRHGSNFSYAGVLTRWLRGLPDAKTMTVLAGDPPPDVIARHRAGLQPDEVLLLAPMPPPDEPWAIQKESLEDVPRFHLARWSAAAVWCVWAGTLAVGLGTLAWATWRSGRRHNDTDWPAAGAVWLLAIFFVSPMTRHYYLALAFPAVAVVWQGLVAELKANAGRWSAGTVLAAAAMLAWLIGVVCLGWNLGRWYGLHLAVLAVLTAAAAWAWRRTIQRSAPSHETSQPLHSTQHPQQRGLNAATGDDHGRIET